MTLLIAMTGATGFAGRHTLRALLQAGHRVRALVRDASRAGLGDGVETVTGDLNNPAALAALTAGADAIVHVAGAIMALDRAGFFAVNEAGTQALLRAAEQAGVRRLVHVSSLAAREPQLSHYAASKQAGKRQ